MRRANEFVLMMETVNYCHEGRSVGNMSETFETKVSINRSGTTNTAIVLDAQNGNITSGGHGVDGDVFLRDGSGTQRIAIDAGNHTIKITDASGNTLAELGRFGNLRLGGGRHDGDIEMYNTSANRTVHVDGQQGNMWLGGNGVDGDLILFPSGATDTNATSQSTIHLDGQAGDIILRNADAAEDFDVAGEGIEAGSVLVIDEEGRLRLSSNAYDRRVAGVVSGDGPYRPGIILDRQPETEGRKPIALAGKVQVKADATQAPIQVGDLLTTSPEAGHAMRACDPSRAFGAVIGKALAPLHRGLGSVPILVSLQ